MNTARLTHREARPHGSVMNQAAARTAPLSMIATMSLLMALIGVGCSESQGSSVSSTSTSVPETTITPSTTALSQSDESTPTDEPARDAGSEQALEFFRGTRTACVDHAESTGNPVVPDEWFDDARVVEDLGDGAWLVIDGADNRLVVEPDEGVVYSEDGRDAALSNEYSFGCPETVYLGSLDH